MKRVTIKDVAREAGVSITTVSHSLSGGGNIRQETRDRVIEIAGKMRYMPDWKGRNLKAAGTGIIGLFVASIRGYYGQLADAMYEKCHRADYEFEVFLTDSGDSLLQTLLSGRVDGAVILHSKFTKREEKALLEAEIPTVFLDREVKKEKVSSVLLDSRETGAMAAEYLYSLGHRKIMLVKGADTYDGVERRSGFENYLREKKAEPDQDYIIDGAFDQRIAYDSMIHFLDKGLPLPDAVFAANDESAFGCIKALTDKGFRVPGQISVMGCDDIELSRWYMPALTSVCTHISMQGETAAEELLGLISGDKKGTIRKIKGELVERNSCRSRQVSKSETGNRYLT